MSPEKQAAAIRKIAEGLYEYADLLFEQPQALLPAAEAVAASDPPRTAAAAQPSEMSPFLAEVEDAPLADQGSLANCPKHRVPFTDGQYGPYCKQATDDLAWGKQKGDRLWCKITPKNAAEWLRMQAAA